MASEYPRSQAEFDSSTQVPRSEYEGYASTEAPRGTSQYQLAPYDEEKAYAEYNRVYGPESTNGHPLPTDSDSRYERRAPRRRRKVRYTDERSDDLKSYDSYGRLYDDLSRPRRSAVDDSRDYYHDGRPSLPMERSDDGKDPEHGLKSALIGGASGAYLGSRLLGKGTLGTLGGAVAGAIGVNAIEHFDGKRQQKKRDGRYPQRREDDSEYTPPRERGSGYYSHDEFVGSPARSRYDSRPPPHSRHGDRPRRGRSRSYSSDVYY